MDAKKYLRSWLRYNAIRCKLPDSDTVKLARAISIVIEYDEGLPTIIGRYEIYKEMRKKDESTMD